jgi:phage major head subunit gpT-like protein
LFYDKVSMTINSTHKTEVNSFMKRLLGMREWIGPRVKQNLSNFEYLLTNKKYEDTLSVPVDDIADDSLGVYDIMFQEFGAAIAKWPDQLMKPTIQGGKVGTGFDGKPFFGTTHDLDPAGNQSNLFTGTALSATNFNTVRSAMVSYTGEDGELLAAMPNTLVVPPQLVNTAREIVNAGLVGGGNTNTQQGAAQILEIPELANEPTVWYLMDLSSPVKPFIFQQRMAPQMVAKTDLSSENVFNDDELVWGAKARGTTGYGPWWLAARCEA